MYRCSVGSLAETGRQHGLKKTALVLVGDFLSGEYDRSRLYAPEFTTAYRKGTEQE